MIRFCIVGCGRIATLNTLGYLQHPQAQVYAVCDTDPARAEALAKELGAEKIYARYEDVLADERVDAIDLLVPHHLHHAMTIAACKAGKHISVQKPMAMNLRECDEMIAAAKENGVVLKVFENFVFYPPYVKAKELIDAGEIGEPSTIRLKMVAGANKHGWHVDPATWMWRMEEESCGGGPLVFDDGNHKFSLARYFMGEPERVFAYIDSTPMAGEVYTKDDGSQVQFYEDAPAMIIWKYKDSKRYGVFDITYAPDLEVNSSYYACDERVEINGSKGTIWINRCTGNMMQEPSVTLYRDGQTQSWHALRDDWADSFIDSTKDFIDALVEGREPVLTGEDGKAVLKFSLAAIASGKSGEQVLLDDFTDGGTEQ